MHSAAATRAQVSGPCCSSAPLPQVHARRCAAPFRQQRRAHHAIASAQQQHQEGTCSNSATASCEGSQRDAWAACSSAARIDRRSLLQGAAMAAVAMPLLQLSLGTSPAMAFTPPPAGFRLQVDKLDGYAFIYPETWLQVTSSGNDIFLRNPRNIDENLFVDMSSPSSSRYESVIDLGTPQEAAERILDQYLTREFMSTRIGIRREGSVLSAVERTGSDGRKYYDLAIRMTSYGSASPYLATRDEVMASYSVEWDRVLLTTLGVANMRLYELRFQTAFNTYDSSKPTADKIANSFTVKEVDATPSVPLPASLRAF